MAYRIPYFKEIGKNYSVRLQMFTCAIAVGTCCSAGAPFGGVLFAFELTATFFMVGTFWKSLLATASAIIIYQVLHSHIPAVKPPNFTNFEEYQINHELIFIVILGWMSAQIGALFINTLTKIIFLKAKLKNPLLLHRWKWCLIVSLFISIIQYPLRILHFPER
jgi:chloride channel 2